MCSWFSLLWIPLLCWLCFTGGCCYLITGPRSPPRLIIAVNESGGIVDAYVVADTVQVQVPVNAPHDMCSLICSLLACYFAWDLSYPTGYQILVFLHHHLLTEKTEKMFKSVRLLKLEKRLKSTHFWSFSQFRNIIQATCYHNTVL